MNSLRTKKLFALALIFCFVIRISNIYVEANPEVEGYEEQEDYLESQEEVVLQIVFEDKIMNFVSNFDGVIIPKGFDETFNYYLGTEIKIFNHIDEEIDLSLVCLSDEFGNIDFYTYSNNEVKSIYKQFIFDDVPFGYFGINQAEHEKEDFNFIESIEVLDVTISGWEFEEEIYSNYYLLYFMSELGVMNYYVYDINEKTVVTLSAFHLVNERGNSIVSREFIIAVVTITIISSTFIYSIFFYHKGKNKRIKQILKNVNKEVFDDLPITYVKKEQK